MHAQRHRLGPGQGVQAVIGTIGLEHQPLAQLLAPGSYGPEQRQRLGIGRYGGGQGVGGGAAAASPA
ncbi:MAG: hypothetical protein ACKO3F_11695 [Cyanobium sp.]